jgi:nicotinate-nucleotide adenylyltransferase
MKPLIPTPYPVIGIFGGTFDPIHSGHLCIADLALKTLGLHEIRFIPNQHPPHRPPPLASAEHRIQMIQLAIADHPHWRLDLREINRPGPSYMIDTLKSLRQEYPTARFFLILGEDAWKSLPLWHQSEQLSQYCDYWVYPRDPMNPVNPATPQSSQLPRYPAIPISSSEIRNKLRGHNTVDHLVPPAVRDYIRQYRLYEIPSVPM